MCFICLMFFLQFECSSYSFNLTRYQGSGVISAFRTNGEGSSSFLLVSFGNYSVAETSQKRQFSLVCKIPG